MCWPEARIATPSDAPVTRTTPARAPSATRIETPIGPTSPLSAIRAYAPASPPWCSAAPVSVVERASTSVARHTIAPVRSGRRRVSGLRRKIPAPTATRSGGTTAAARPMARWIPESIFRPTTPPSQPRYSTNPRNAPRASSPPPIRSVRCCRAERLGARFRRGGVWRVGVRGRRVFEREPAARPRARVVALVIGKEFGTLPTSPACDVHEVQARATGQVPVPVLGDVGKP